MTAPGLNDLRLEVEVPSTGLPNLIQNPSGEKGAWGWITRLAWNTLSSTTLNGETVLYCKTTANNVTQLISEYINVTPGHYVGARLDLKAVTASHNIKINFEFLDASKLYINAGVQSGALTTAGTYYIPATLVPANAAYVVLTIMLYNGTSNPSTNAGFWFRNAMVTSATTSAGLGTATRTNLIGNPSFESNLTGWTKGRASTTLTRDTTTSVFGSAAAKITETAGSTQSTTLSMYTGSPNVSGILIQDGGVDYTLSFYVKSSKSSFKYWAVVYWVELGWQNYETSVKSAVINATGANSWNRHSFTVTAPYGSTLARVQLYANFPSGIAIGDTVHFDGVMFEQGYSLNPYIDTTQTSTAATYNFVEPQEYRNILGPTTNISIKRGALDVGTMQATVIDALLDPAVATVIRPGRKVRVRSFVDGIWQSLFEGNMVNATTTYDKEKKIQGQVKVSIDISATDNIAHLANQGESRGVGTVAALPFILEGKGAPWNVNGSGNQVTSATIVNTNPNASVLDQVAVVRDSALGYAWVDRNNVLNVWNSNNLPTTPVATFSDAYNTNATWLSYTDIDVNFNTDAVINTVAVKWLRFDSVTGSTEEIDYGPYRDVTSIATWGAHTAEFTIGGATESSTAIANYAQSILTANSTPQIRCNSLVMPVRDTKELKYATTLDLYTPVAVKYDTKLDKTLRITGLEHNISPDAWTVTYTFDVQGSVAAPTWTPSPPYTGTTAETAIFNNIYIKSTADANNAANNTPALKIGDASAQHLRIDNNEIIAMNNNGNGTVGSQGTLILNRGAPILANGLIQSGTRSSGTITANTDKTIAIAFPTAFPSAGSIPAITITPVLSNLANPVTFAVNNVTRSGFDLVVRRPNNTSFDICWIATTA